MPVLGDPCSELLMSGCTRMTISGRSGVKRSSADIPSTYGCLFVLQAHAVAFGRARSWGSSFKPIDVRDLAAEMAQREGVVGRPSRAGIDVPRHDG
jgi:hypothetical protein